MKEKLLRSNRKYHQKTESLWQEMAGISEDRLNRKPADGGWSAMQTAWHLLLVEENSLRYVQKKLGFGDTFEKTGIKTAWRSFLLFAALYMPLKFKAPKAASGDHFPEGSSMKELRERWTDVRTSWTDFLSNLPEDLLDKAVYKHPRVGKIGWAQMMDFLHVHFDRHLLQIRKAML